MSDAVKVAVVYSIMAITVAAEISIAIITYGFVTH